MRRAGRVEGLSQGSPEHLGALGPRESGFLPPCEVLWQRPCEACAGVARACPALTHVFAASSARTG